ncbi:hypothetical protein V5E97_27950 [Singulisphaera sp. Ch08]|uniref:Uncharacterized protein n=1 Tax=Singulisphaera sp. Ch08 TaxID=3120278 RepID=A0AAU7CAV4_9BACT
MSEPNHYQVPETATAAFTPEQQLAKMLLQARENGYTLGLFYRWSLRGYLVLFIAISIGIAWFSWVNMAPGIYAMTGLLVGALLRDYGVAKKQVRLWPVQARLLDWEKVQAMANGEA